MSKTLLNSFSIIVGVLTAFLFVVTTQPAVSAYQLKQELKDNCKAYKLPYAADKKIEIDIENEVVEITSPKLKKDVSSSESIKLPLINPETNPDYASCTTEAKEILLVAQDVYDDYVSESCEDFKAIISGEKPLPERDGKKADIAGAKDFYGRFCTND